MAFTKLFKRKQGPCHFLRLPPELRLLIYERAVDRSEIRRVDTTGMPMHPLLQTSKLVREEAFESVHRRTALSFRLHDLRSFVRFGALHGRLCRGARRHHAVRVLVDSASPRRGDGVFDGVLRDWWREREAEDASVRVTFLDRRPARRREACLSHGVRGAVMRGLGVLWWVAVGAGLASLGWWRKGM
ncbi:hypothetical protein LTR08_004926 [Meristemomyces frigidus]|nr:hypothetical protein LTR08_004926 [Meristemomyces frigidus]